MMTDMELITEVRKMLLYFMPMNLMLIWAKANDITVKRLEQAIKVVQK